MASLCSPQSVNMSSTVGFMLMPTLEFTLPRDESATSLSLPQCPPPSPLTPLIPADVFNRFKYCTSAPAAEQPHSSLRPITELQHDSVTLSRAPHSFASANPSPISAPPALTVKAHSRAATHNAQTLAVFIESPSHSPSSLTPQSSSPSSARSPALQPPQQSMTTSLPFSPKARSAADIHRPLNEIFARDSVQSIAHPNTTTSAGIIFVQTSDGLFILKASTTCGQEYFAFKLGEALGVPLCAMRLIAADDDGFSSLIDGLKSVAGDDDTNTHFITVLESSRVVTLIEYCPALPIDQLDSTHVSAFMNDACWTDVGAIVAFDIAINNVDRLPQPVWQHSGNGGNILVSQDKKETRVVGIDHQITTLHDEEATHAYTDKLTALIADVNANGISSQSVAAIRSFMADKTMYCMTHNNCQALVAGMKRTFQKISDSIDGEALTAIKDDVSSFVHDDPKHIFGDMMDAIDIDFLAKIAANIKQAANANISTH